MFEAEHSLFYKAQIQLGQECQSLIALDEVGRGCVAGPVLTCASLWIPSPLAPKAWVSDVRDSKKLSAKKRQTCYSKVLKEFHLSQEEVPLQNSATTQRVQLHKSKSILSFSAEDEKTFAHKTSFQCIGFCLGEANIEEVETFNIWGAVQIAFSRALLGLNENLLFKEKISATKTILLMDGNKAILVPKSFENYAQATAIKGDDFFISVGLSSILAKVHRDLFMESQEIHYPEFGFAKHKGYGTAVHIASILKNGICPLHRQSFLKKYLS
jgi:ribonuclease HII